MVFNLKGRYLYVANEIDSTVSVYTWDSEKGVLYPIQTLTTLPENTTQSNTVADIHLTSSGRFLYVSNRGHDSLAGFVVNEKRGYLIPFGHYPTLGKWPRSFAIDPLGTFLLVANQNSNTVVTFWIEQKTGQLISTGQVTTIPNPVCVKIVDL
jgi:6-phosphogluconolactonase